MSKRLHITSGYCYLNLDDQQTIVQIWKIQGIPFTFDELPEEVQQLPDVILDAQTSTSYTMEDLYHLSNYLIEEEAHPILFNMAEEVDNYEEVPE